MRTRCSPIWRRWTENRRRGGWRAGGSGGQGEAELRNSERIQDIMPGSEMREARCGMRGFRVMFPSRMPHPASRQHCLGGPAELRFMLFWEWSFSEPNVEARPALNGPQLDDSRRSADRKSTRLNS